MAALAYVPPAEAGEPAVLLRSAASCDREAMGTFLRGLSPASAYARFFTGLGNPSASLVRQLVDPAPGRGSWLATRAGAVVGHASWVFAGAGRDSEAEISFVVTDSLQGQGIGHDLIGTVLAELGRTTAEVLRLDVLASNRRVIAMIGRRWPGSPVERDGTQLTYRVPLVGQPRLQ